jgi:hypothetical protein
VRGGRIVGGDVESVMNWQLLPCVKYRQRDSSGVTHIQQGLIHQELKASYTGS